MIIEQIEKEAAQLSCEEKGRLAAFLIEARNAEEPDNYAASDAQSLARLKEQVREGFESLDRGEGIVLENKAELHAFMEDVKRRGQARLAELSQ
jgi:hypothetical protein